METPRNVHSTSTITTSLVVLGNFIQPLVPYMARHNGTSIDAAFGTRTRKEIKDRGRWKSDRSVLRYEQRARLHNSFHWLPAAYQAHALRCDNVLHKVTSSRRSVNLFLPMRPRGAYFVVLSNVGCKVGRGIRQCGFLVGWYNLNFESADLPFRSDWPCARRSALSILCLLDRLSCLRNESKMVKCLGSETSLAAQSVRQPAVPARNHLHPRLAKIGNSMDYDSSSLLSSVCLLEQHHRSHSITFDLRPLETRGSYAAN